jgi:hypothetical protein
MYEVGAGDSTREVRTLAKPHMTPLMIEYLMAACEEIQGDIEKAVDAVALRKRLTLSPEQDGHAQHKLQYHDYITTKGAGKVPIGFFWVTEEGIQAAIEEGSLSGWAEFFREGGGSSGWAKFFREGWEEHSSRRVLRRRIAWLLSDELEKVADPERTPLESKVLYEMLTTEGWGISASAMDKIFEEMEEQGLIRTSTVEDGDEVAAHGNRKIWVAEVERLLA